MLLAVSAVLESECCFLLTLGLMTDPKFVIIVLNRTRVLTVIWQFMLACISSKFALEFVKFAYILLKKKKGHGILVLKHF